MRYLVTGGCGFVGSNLAAAVLRQGGELCVLDNLSRSGSSANLAWLRGQGSWEFIHGDIRDARQIEQLVREFMPHVIFHLAGQVAMTASLADPRADFEINALGALNILEALRLHSPRSILIYSSSNKVYGDLEWLEYEETDKRFVARGYPHGFAEDLPLDFHSPYGCSKGSAEQYVLDYARQYGMRTVVFRHSSMYGGRQFSTADQGWVGWFCQQALAQAGGDRSPFTISGSGKQVRDLLHADDLVRLYFAVVSRIDAVQGEVMNIGGGMANSLSLLELFDLLEEVLNADLDFIRLDPRASDQRVFVADTRKARKLLDWSPEVGAREGINQVLEWLDQHAQAAHDD